MIKAVFFDLGDTLIRNPEHSGGRHDLFLQSQLEKLGYKKSLEEIEKAREKTWKYIEKNYRGSTKRYKEGFVSSILFKNLEIEIDREKLLLLEEERRNNHAKDAQLMPNAKEVLKFLRGEGYKLVMVTNNSVKWANHYIEKFNLRKHFDHIIISEEVGKEKSTTVPFKIALEKTGLNPEEVIVVGDRSDEDIYGAKVLGMETVKIKNPHPTFGETREADYEIKDLIELKEILKSIK